MRSYLGVSPTDVEKYGGYRKMNLKSSVVAAANHTGLLDGYTLLRKAFLKSHIVILIYHRIAPEKDFGFLKPLHPASFEKQIAYLTKNYKIISLDELAQMIRWGDPPKEKIAVITIDDGYKDNYLHAYPLLRKYHVPATIFLSTGNIENERPFWCDEISYLIRNTTLKKLKLQEIECCNLNIPHNKDFCINELVEKLKRCNILEIYTTIDTLSKITEIDVPNDLKDFILSWEEIRKMSRNDIHFGAHTVTHTILTNLQMEKARYEILQSKNDIEEHINQEVKAFSYPNGTCRDFNREIISLIKDARFTCAVTTIPTLITMQSNLFTLGRVNGSINDFNKVKAYTSGLYADYLFKLRYGSDLRHCIP